MDSTVYWDDLPRMRSNMALFGRLMEKLLNRDVVAAGIDVHGGGGWPILLLYYANGSEKHKSLHPDRRKGFDFDESFAQTIKEFANAFAQASRVSVSRAGVVAWPATSFWRVGEERLLLVDRGGPVDIVPKDQQILEFAKNWALHSNIRTSAHDDLKEAWRKIRPGGLIDLVQDQDLLAVVDLSPSATSLDTSNSMVFGQKIFIPPHPVLIGLVRLRTRNRFVYSILSFIKRV